jgi:hypothetical protein
MLGLPLWFWVLAGVVLLVVVVVRSFYARFRGMCRAVRGELTEYLKAEYPEVQVVGEQQGNLVLRMADGGERVFEMADVYTAVAQLPGMGQDPAARTRIYQQAAAALLPAPPASSRPLAPATHGSRIKPQLVRPETVTPSEPGPGVLQTPVPGLELVVVYVLDLPGDSRHLTEQDRAELGTEVAEIHRLALDNLRKDFPRQMVTDAVAGESGTAIQFGDSFDATRLLLVPECLQTGEELAALVPHRDMLVLLPAAFLQDHEKLREAVGLLDCDHPPLLGRPVHVTPDGFNLI